MRSAYRLTLFSEAGKRKYVCASELSRFLEAARRSVPETYAFCCLLAYTGCRISEALALTPGQLDAETGHVIFRTLKRRRLIYRAVPIPPDLLAMLQRLGKEVPLNTPLWQWCRQTGYRKVKSIMVEAGISGPQAMPKGLRHGFGVGTAESNVPVAMTQNWLGHASLETTAIYMQAVGKEERAFAQRLWRHWRGS